MDSECASSGHGCVQADFVYAVQRTLSKSDSPPMSSPSIVAGSAQIVIVALGHMHPSIQDCSPCHVILIEAFMLSTVAQDQLNMCSNSKRCD